MRTSINTKEFGLALSGKQNYFSQSINGTGRVRHADNGKVNYFVVLRGSNLTINREGVYDSNRYVVCETEVNSMDELVRVVNEKCGL